MFAFVIFTFGICWLPYHVYFIYSYHNPQVGQKLHYRFQKCVFNTGIILNVVSASPPLNFLLFPDYEVASHQKHLPCFLLARNGENFSSVENHSYRLLIVKTAKYNRSPEMKKANKNSAVLGKRLAHRIVKQYHHLDSQYDYNIVRGDLDTLFESQVVYIVVW